MTTTLGQKIAELRKARSITQDELAERMGVSAQAVSKWENDLSCPDITVLPELADFFGVTIDTLLRGDRIPEAHMVPVEDERDLNKVLLKIIVNSANGDKVRVNLPFSLVKAGLEIGMNMPEMGGSSNALKDIDFVAIVRAVERGVVGNLVEVDSADGTRVNIWVD